MRVLYVLFVTMLAVGCAAPMAAPTRTPTDTVTVAELGTSSEAAIYIGIDRGYFAEQGINVQLVPFKVATDIVPAVATGHVDVGTGSPTAALFNALASGIPLKIVASNARLEPGRDGGALVLRSELANVVRTAADLKGRRLGIMGSTGNIAQLMYERVLGSAGLSESDVDLVAIPGMPEMLTALQTGRVDGAIVAEPWVSLGVSQGSVFIWKHFSEIAPSMENNLLVYSSGFAKQREDVARRFMVARLKAVRDYEDGFFGSGDRSALVSILTKYTPITDPTVYERMSFSQMDPDGRVNAAALEQLQQWYVTHGYVATAADVNAAMEPSFATYALGILGSSHSN